MSINEVLGRDPTNPQSFCKILASNIEGFIQPIVSPTLTNVLTSGNTAGGLDINASGSSVIASHIKTSSLEGQTVLETIEITNPLKATNLAITASPLSKILYMDDATKDIKSGDAPQQNIDYADYKYFIKNNVKSRYGLNNTLAVPTIFNVANEGDLQTAIFSTATYKLINLTTDIFLTAPLTITRPTYIYGSSYIIQSATPQTIIPTLLNIQGDNIVFDSVILRQEYETSNSSCVNLNASGAMVAFVDCVFETVESAITGSWNDFYVLSTQFSSLATDSHRYIFPKNISGLTVFDSCTFQGNVGNNTRIIQINTTGIFGIWKGCKFVLSNCSTFQQTNCQQLMETQGNPFTAGNGFELYLINNNFRCSNGAVIFVQSQANLSGIRALYGYNNTITMTGGSLSKGLFAFFIGNGLQVPSNILYYMKGNTLNDNLRADYSDITIVQNKTITVGYTPYTFPLVSLDLKDLHYLQSDLLISNYANINEANINEANINEANINEANINEANINVLGVGRIKPTEVISKIYPLDNWIALSVGDENTDNGTGNQPPKRGDRIVMGNLGTLSFDDNFATIGAHSHQLNQWRDLYINPDPNVSIISCNLKLISPNQALNPLLELRTGAYHHRLTMVLNTLVIDARGENNQFGAITFKVGTGLGGTTADSRRIMDMNNDGSVKMFDITGNNLSVLFWYNAPSQPSAYVVEFTFTDIGTPTRGFWYLQDTGIFGITSDKRIKKNIRYLDVEKSYNFIKKLRPCVFNHINHEQDILGFIAQDVLSACETEAQHTIVSNSKYYLDYKATHNGEEPDDIRLGVSQTSMIPELVCAFQSVVKDIDELKTRLNESETNLYKRLNQSETKYSELETKYSELETKYSKLETDLYKKLNQSETKLSLLEQKFNEFLKQQIQQIQQIHQPLDNL